MKIVVAGGTGLIGSALTSRLLDQGHSVATLTRSPVARMPARNQRWHTWSPPAPGAWQKAIDGADAVVNLAGEPIAAKRWSEAQKKKIRSSRIDSTRALVEAIAKAERKPRLFINGSAVGYYGPHGDEVLTESSPPGDDFLARVCVAWEDEAMKAQEHGVAVVRLRTGIVLAREGGALAKMAPPFKLFAGGTLGSGRQWMPWIHLEDEIGLILFLLEHPEARGAVNAAAPNPATMKEFCQTLGRVLRRPCWAPVPAFALRLMLGEMAEMLLAGQRVMPDAARRLGYSFRYPNLHDALSACMPL
jgi:uncharacterized protein (TIGR01777 family)